MLEDIESEINQKKRLLQLAIENSDSAMGFTPYFLVAKLGDLVVGTISIGHCGEEIQKCTNNELSGILELGSLYVLSDFQGKGIGSALIHAMMNTLSNWGVEEFCLDSGYKHAQQRWLSKFGKPYRVVKDYWGPGMDHLIWLGKVRALEAQGHSD